MAVEIERKFLVNKESLPRLKKGTDLKQGYLHISREKSIRVRQSGKKAFLTIKGPDVNGQRSEFEFSIPYHDSSYLLDHFCISSIIVKTRRCLFWKEKLWEIDEFLGDNSGLWIAEVELDQPGEAIELPSWVGEEVTGNKKYYNTYLSQHPFSQWG